MTKIWNWEDEANDLLTIDQIIAELSGLKIIRAEVRRLEKMFPDRDDIRNQGTTFVNVAFVRAKKGG